MNEGDTRRVQEPPNRGAGDSTRQSIEMLKAVIAGETYEAVAARFGKSRTAVERRVKSIASHLSRQVGIQGLNEGGTTFVRRLRLHEDAILAALAVFDPSCHGQAKEIQILSREEIVQAALRIKGRSSHPWHDIALFYVLFVTGVRPLEIARLEVRDYLDMDGRIRRESELRAEVSITGKARALYFASTPLNDALSHYLRERLERGLGLQVPGLYRGLDPCSRLFLSTNGMGFKITPNGRDGQSRFVCRAILERYDKLFKYAEIERVTARSARRTTIARLYERGADEGQVGFLMGISERSAVRALFSRPKPTIDALVNELI